MSKQQERAVFFEWQKERVQRRIDALENRSRRFWQMKLADMFIGIFMVVVAFKTVRWLCIPLVLVTMGIFLFINRIHHKVDQSFVRYRILHHIKMTQIARIKLDWDNLPAVQPRDSQTTHPFEIDLDITGDHSLYRLLNAGVSLEGGERLRQWLLNPVPDLDVIRQRQILIQELAPLVLFREKLMLHSLFATRYSASELEGQKLLLWLDAQRELDVPRSALIIPTLLSASTLLLVVLHFIINSPIALSIIPCLLSLGWYLWTGRNRSSLAMDTSYLRNAFDQLYTVFRYLEKYPYGKHIHLKKLCEPFLKHAGNSPSLLLRQLSRLGRAANLENTGWIALILNALIPWDFYVAHLLSRYRARIAKLLPVWLDIWYELEVLSSLANFAYLHPEYVMPEFALENMQDTPTLFRATGLGHPLIEDEKKVENDFTINHHNEIVLITGSNMAGKSTFLRTIGINLCLAYTGAPVNATSLQMSLFEIFACIKIADSVTDGYSYFYAEVRRLKALLSRLEEGAHYPIFFLIDEIFKGTNNRERLIGSTAYIEALVGKNCIGAISTHDLELVKLADMWPKIKNYHFREEVINGRMVFDYKLQHGPCPTTNALKIMQLEGLPTSTKMLPHHLT